MARLADRVAIVTGAAGGLGAAYARAMAKEGARVVVADVKPGAAVVAQIVASGGVAFDRPTDVADEPSVVGLVADTLARFGRVDILVNNAGLLTGLARGTIEEHDVAEWDRVMAVNVRGPFLCAKHVAPAMRRQGYGKIINVASSAGFSGGRLQHHYAVSKGALVTLTRGLARELGAESICVNAIAPGLTMSEGVLADPFFRSGATDHLVSQRAIRREEVPEDLVGTILYLASADSDFVTGQTIVVDGGVVMR